MRLTPADLDGVTGWKKSTRSGAAGHCVEVAAVTPDLIAVRNSNHREAGATGFTRDEFAAFVDGVKAGEFDVPR